MRAEPLTASGELGVERWRLQQGRTTTISAVRVQPCAHAEFEESEYVTTVAGEGALAGKKSLWRGYENWRHGPSAKTETSGKDVCHVEDPWIGTWLWKQGSHILLICVLFFRFCWVHPVGLMYFVIGEGHVDYLVQFM